MKKNKELTIKFNEIQGKIHNKHKQNHMISINAQ